MIDKLKGAWKSWTIRFNAGAALVIAYLPMAQDSFPQMHQFLPDNVYQIGMLVLVVANTLLRFKTNTCLSQR